VRHLHVVVGGWVLVSAAQEPVGSFVPDLVPVHRTGMVRLVVRLQKQAGTYDRAVWSVPVASIQATWLSEGV